MAAKTDKNKLNQQQELFCHEYVISLNGTDAYLKAGYKVKSNKIAQVNASRLLSNAIIQAKIQQLRQTQLDKLEIQEEQVIKELVNHAWSNMTNYVEATVAPDLKSIFSKLRKSNILTDAEKGRLENATGRTIRIKNIHLLSPEQQRCIKKLSESKDGTVTIELVDKQKPLELIGKNKKMFTDRVDHGGKIIIQDELANLTDKEIEERVKRLEIILDE